MATNTSAALQTTLDDLNRQHHAAVRRQQDLEQQLKTAQESMSKLGFMQLGKKMLLKAEIDSINAKLTANRQLQESLTGRITAATAELEAALAEESAAAEVAAPVIEMAVPVEAALGCVLASPCVGCPPAVPIVICGERIDENALAAFRYYGITHCEVVDDSDL